MISFEIVRPLRTRFEFDRPVPCRVRQVRSSVAAPLCVSTIPSGTCSSSPSSSRCAPRAVGGAVPLVLLAPREPISAPQSRPPHVLGDLARALVGLHSGHQTSSLHLTRHVTTPLSQAHLPSHRTRTFAATRLPSPVLRSHFVTLYPPPFSFAWCGRAAGRSFVACPSAT